MTQGQFRPRYGKFGRGFRVTSGKDQPGAVLAGILRKFDKTRFSWPFDLNSSIAVNFYGIKIIDQPMNNNIFGRDKNL